MWQWLLSSYHCLQLKELFVQFLASSDKNTNLCSYFYIAVTTVMDILHLKEILVEM